MMTLNSQIDARAVMKSRDGQGSRFFVDKPDVSGPHDDVLLILTLLAIECSPDQTYVAKILEDET